MIVETYRGDTDAVRYHLFNESFHCSPQEENVDTYVSAGNPHRSLTADVLTAWANSLTREFRRSVSSTITLVMVLSDIVRLVRAAQCRMSATCTTVSVSWREQERQS